MYCIIINHVFRGTFQREDLICSGCLQVVITDTKTAKVTELPYLNWIDSKHGLSHVLKSGTAAAAPDALSIQYQVKG